MCGLQPSFFLHSAGTTALEGGGQRLVRGGYGATRDPVPRLCHVLKLLKMEIQEENFTPACALCTGDPKRRNRRFTAWDVSSSVSLVWFGIVVWWAFLLTRV
jgi:hypothetical protein